MRSAEPVKLHSATAAVVLYGKGMAMGLGDSVPGISGGTIAVITGIYDSLIYSIRAVDSSALQLLLQGQPGRSWQHCNGNFLLVLAAGIFSGLLISANTVLYLLQHQFEMLMGFFVGLVLASSVLLLPRIRLRQPWQCALLLVGAGLTGLVGLLEPQVVEPSLGFVFVSGAVAICAMILPGLSGAFVLLLLGAYQPMLLALANFELATIAVFMAGCACGLLAFSRLLAWLLRSYHQLGYSLIIGMLLGSLTVLWPWQRVLQVFTDTDGMRHVVQTALVWPLHYTESTGGEPRILGVLLAVVAGVALVSVAGKLFAHSNHRQP